MWMIVPGKKRGNPLCAEISDNFAILGGLVSDEEIEATARQFVRKVTGYRQPSRANRESFDQAVSEVSAAIRTLMDNLVTR